MDKITNAFRLYQFIVKVQMKYYKISYIFLDGNIGHPLGPEILIQEPKIHSLGRGTHGITIRRLDVHRIIHSINFALLIK